MKFLFAAAISPREIYISTDRFVESLNNPSLFLIDGEPGVVVGASASTDSSGRAGVILRLKKELKIGRAAEIGMIGADNSAFAYASSVYSRFWFLDVEGLPEISQSDSIFSAEGKRIVIDSRYFRGKGAISSVSSRLDPLSGNVSTETLVVKLADVDKRLSEIFASDLPAERIKEYSLLKSLSAENAVMYITGRDAAWNLSPGDFLYMGREAARVISIAESDGTDAIIYAERGALGTNAAAHGAQTPVYNKNRVIEGRRAVLYLCEAPDYNPKVAFKGAVDSLSPSSDGLGYDLKICDMLSIYDKPLSEMFATAHYRDFNLKKILDDGKGNETNDYLAITAHASPPPAGIWTDDYEWASGRWHKHFNDSDFYFGRPTIGDKIILPLARYNTPSSASLDEDETPYYETLRGFDEIHNDDAPCSRGYSLFGAPFAYVQCSPRPQIFKAERVGRKYIRKYALLNPSRYAVSDLHTLEDWQRRGAILSAGLYDVLIGEFLPHSLALPQGNYGDVGDAAAAYSNLQIATAEKAKIETLSEVLPLKEIYGGMTPIQAAGLLLTGYLRDDRLLTPKYCAELPTDDLFIYSGGPDGAESALYADGVVCLSAGESLVKTVQKELLGPICRYLTASRTGRIAVSSLMETDYDGRTSVSRADLSSVSATFERTAPAISKVRYKFGYDVYSGKYSSETSVDAPDLSGKEKVFELKLLCAANASHGIKSPLCALAQCGMLWLSKFGRPQYTCSFTVVDKDKFRDLCPGVWIKLDGLPFGANRFGQGEIYGDGLIVDCKYFFDEGKIELKTLIIPRDDLSKTADRRNAALAFGAPAAMFETDGITKRLYFKVKSADSVVGIVGMNGAPYGLELSNGKLPRLKLVDIKRGEENLQEKVTVCAWGAASIDGEPAIFAESQSLNVPWMYQLLRVVEETGQAVIEGNASGRFSSGDLARFGSRGDPAILERVEYDSQSDETALFWAFGDKPPQAGDNIWNAENLFVVDDFSNVPYKEITNYNAYMDDGFWRAPGFAVIEGEYTSNQAAALSARGDLRAEFNGCTGLIVWPSDDKSADIVFYPEVTNVVYNVDEKRTVLSLASVMPNCPSEVFFQRKERGETWREPNPGPKVDSSEDFYYKFS